jgi:hypothetical protein
MQSKKKVWKVENDSNIIHDYLKCVPGTHLLKRIRVFRGVAIQWNDRLFCRGLGGSISGGFLFT